MLGNMYTRKLLKLFRNGRNKMSKKNYSSDHHEDEYVMSKDGRKIKVIYEPIVYRNQRPPITTGPRIKIQTAMGVFHWYIVLYSFWRWPEFLLGEHYRPDVSMWTNEELGIPPLDYDEVFDD